MTSKDESFLDLSLDFEQNHSISSCLKIFSSTEILSGDEKFFCDTCRSKQEAQKRIKIKKLPLILVLHLKRFKYMEQVQRYKKLMHRVVFPLELRLPNTVQNELCTVPYIFKDRRRKWQRKIVWTIWNCNTHWKWTKPWSLCDDYKKLWKVVAFWWRKYRSKFNQVLRNNVILRLLTNLSFVLLLVARMKC